MRQAVFFDIDGTLWDYQMKIPDSTVKAVRKLRENGHYAFICSGRSRATIRSDELLNIGFDGILAGCGTYIEYNHQVIFEYRIPWEKLVELVLIMREQNLAVLMEGSRNLYADLDMFKGDKYVVYLSHMLGENMCSLGDLDGESIVNKMCIDFRWGTREAVSRALEKDYTLIYHGGTLIEAVPKGYSKATAIEYICSHLQVSRENTYAFGDGPNDLEMLAYAGHGIVMGNAADGIKAKADYVTKSVSEDGIWAGLEHFGLI